MNFQVISYSEHLHLGSYGYFAVYSLECEPTKADFIQLQNDLFRDVIARRKWRLARGFSKYMLVLSFNQEFMGNWSEVATVFSVRNSYVRRYAVSCFPIILSPKGDLLWKLGVQNNTLLIQKKLDVMYGDAIRYKKSQV